MWTEVKREHISVYQTYKGKIENNDDFVPDKIGADSDGQYRNAIEVEGLAIASNHPHVCRGSNWRFETMSIVNGLID